MPRTAARTTPLPTVAVAACAFSALVADAQDAGNGRVLMQITPAQDFLPSDGREMDVPAWRINEAIAGRVIAAHNPAQPPVIDYEHQTLHKEANGQPAPAAGWIHGLRWLHGKGLYAEVELTQRARDLVAAGEYRYFSPVFEYAKGTGDVVRVLMGALTNHPAIAGMDAINLMAAATARFGANPHPNPPETTVTLLEKLLAAIRWEEVLRGSDLHQHPAIARILRVRDQRRKCASRNGYGGQGCGSGSSARHAAMIPAAALWGEVKRFTFSALAHCTPAVVAA